MSGLFIYLFLYQTSSMTLRLKLITTLSKLFKLELFDQVMNRELDSTESRHSLFKSNVSKRKCSVLL